MSSNNTYIKAIHRMHQINMGNAAKTYADTIPPRECVSSMHAPGLTARKCDHEMFEAVIRALGDILKKDLEWRAKPPFFEENASFQEFIEKRK